MTTTAVVYHQPGKPLEVLKVTGLETGEPGEGEVLVSQIVAPINPADLNAIEGTYPARPSHYPAVPGVEGVGIVERVGPGVERLQEGMAVVLPHHFGTWREAGVLKESLLTVVPQGVPLQEAAMLKINPATAWRMLHDFVPPRPGGWVIQNASNSAVGRHVIAMAKELGLKTLNLVRRPELVEELTSLGADVVLTDDAEVKEKVKKATGGEPVLLGLNAVGGESGGQVASALAHGGTMVT
ncbi:MAG TPA: 2-enoyl thioester reductase domain-containing protein, partial [Chthoniobacteraceae bacterium]|nr:2-enoyl thioester reductase domain-containing protein [Chthoniobacteraceae bacterium]